MQAGRVPYSPFHQTTWQRTTISPQHLAAATSPIVRHAPSHPTQPRPPGVGRKWAGRARAAGHNGQALEDKGYGAAAKWKTRVAHPVACVRREAACVLLLLRGRGGVGWGGETGRFVR